MAIRLRETLTNSVDMPVNAPRFLEILGIPVPEADGASDRDNRATLFLAARSPFWSGLAHSLALVIVVWLLFGSDQPRAPDGIGLWLFAGATMVPVAEMLFSTGFARKRLAAIAPRSAAIILTAYSFVAGLAWGLLASSLVGQQEIAAGSALAAVAISLLASTAFPAAILSRLGGLMLAFLFVTGMSDWSLFHLTFGALIIVMTYAQSKKHWHIGKHQREVDQRGQTARRMLANFENSGQGWFWRTDLRGNIAYLSPPLVKRLGVKMEDVKGKPFSDLITSDHVADFGTAQAEHTVEFTLSAGLSFSDLIVRAAGMEDRWWSLSGTPLQGRNGRFEGFMGSGTDLTEQRKSEADAARLALYDGLTELPNRTMMRKTLENLLHADQSRQANCALFMLDLDRFKNVNDTLGHPVGDALLKQVSQRLARVVGASGQVGRIGGDEFMVLIPEVVDRLQLTQLSESIVSRLSLPYTIDDCSVQIGATIGIALSPLDGDNSDELTRNADLALYAAKAAGKGVHRFYQPEMHAIADDRRFIENDLRDVLTTNQLSVVYQPVVNAQSEAIIGFEALLRWNHPTRGWVPPSEFIPIAEEIGLISRIGDWVVRTACAEAASWPDHLRIAVNLSPLQFASPGLSATIISALADSGISPDRLEIEITEGVFLNESPETERIFARLSSIGVRIVLDDFGTGYASLGYLKRVPFSKIKIDQSFVRGAASEGSRNMAIIRAIVGLAESLDMETVAEGVETLEEIEFIRTLGCTQIQGYIFGQPIDADQARSRASACVSVADESAKTWVDREQRLALLRFAKLHSDGTTHLVKMRNISAKGATLEADSSAAIGHVVTLELTEGWTFPGEVRWRKGSRFGIEFLERVDVDSIVQSGNVVAKMPHGDDGAPAVTTGDDSAPQRRIAPN